MIRNRLRSSVHGSFGLAAPLLIFARDERKFQLLSSGAVANAQFS
jgi:hypothetical protein